MNISNLMWMVTLVSMIGVVMNIKKRKESFIIWMFTNFIWAVYDLSIKAYAQSFLFFVYFILAIWGIYEWRKK
jgi:hypothetical protein